MLLRGVLDLCVLALLEDRPVYGYEIAAELKARGLDVGGGSIYPLLARLQIAGDVHSSEQASPSGPPRKYWTLTRSGRATLGAGRLSWEQMSNAVSAVLSPDHASPESPVRGVRP
jgi:PadR family transcriptional regulator PadR